MPGFALPSATSPAPAPAPATVPAVPAFWRFPAHPASVRWARRAVAEALPYGFGSQLAGDLGLLMSELVTNAVRYGPRLGGDPVVELVLWLADGHCWVAVSDAGSGLPVVGSPEPEACGGRGLLLVDALADAWAVVPRRTPGKSVVAGLRL